MFVTVIHGAGVQQSQFKDFTESRRFTETMENKPIFDIKARCGHNNVHMAFYVQIPHFIQGDGSH